MCSSISLANVTASSASGNTELVHKGQTQKSTQGRRCHAQPQSCPSWPLFSLQPVPRGRGSRSALWVLGLKWGCWKLFFWEGGGGVSALIEVKYFLLFSKFSQLGYLSP